MPRTKLEICVDILAALAHSGPLKFTNIRQKANYHANGLKEHLEFLERNGFVFKRTTKRKWTEYLVTKKGVAVLRRFSELKRLFALT
ncbi:MAG: winged helix-turn-helix domain-containing protein [Candidatus Bathyarchaeia archaeon]